MHQNKRNSIFESIDKSARDSEGKQIEFGEDYVYSEGEDEALNETLTAVGLDLRAPGYIMVWSQMVDPQGCSVGRYLCIRSSRLKKK